MHTCMHYYNSQNFFSFILTTKILFFYKVYTISQHFVVNFIPQNHKQQTFADNGKGLRVEL